jgi:hypothetical protein
VEKSRQKPNERMKVLSDVGVFAELWKDVIPIVNFFLFKFIVLVFCCRL